MEGCLFGLGPLKSKGRGPRKAFECKALSANLQVQEEDLRTDKIPITLFTEPPDSEKRKAGPCRMSRPAGVLRSCCSNIQVLFRDADYARCRCAYGRIWQAMVLHKVATPAGDEKSCSSFGY